MVKREPIHWDNDGIRLAGERWDAGPGAETILLLHGGGQTHHSWKRTAERLACDGRTAIALDARGHGDSEWQRHGEYTLDGFVGDVIALIRTLDQTPVLVGASLGGITSLILAGEHPTLVRALVLVDIVVHPEIAGVKRITDFMTAHRDGFATLEQVADAIAAYNPLRPRPASLDGLRKNVRQREDGRWYWHWDPEFMRIDDEPQRHVPARRLAVAARKLRLPTLIVRGGESDLVSDAAIEDMTQLVPHASTVDVRAAGHMVAGDDNDVFTADLESFLDSLPPASCSPRA
jgi:pimeloyl-ACP methyl ester carboxylesterase